VKGDAGKGVVLVDRLATRGITSGTDGGGDWVIFPKPSVGAILGTGELKGDIGTDPALPIPPVPKPPAIPEFVLPKPLKLCMPTKFCDGGSWVPKRF
jgi:hypothetical protein